jgi:uroporphyrin-III C-methyltransferase / precorrin-2 dehydrogenase / sirohydrochlorin ferrochelatase
MNQTAKLQTSNNELLQQRNSTSVLATGGDTSETYEQSEITKLTIKKKNGEVFLVGAGPGDGELLTLKAYKLLQTADVVLYDALVSREILALIGKQAELIDVGKRANHHYVTQQQTNRLLVKYARLGKQVVRLKGGDPFIFGRGGEELQALKAHNIRFQVVPGITAASGCTSYAGIPLTHRDFTQSVRFVTAHQKEKDAVNWKSLAELKQTLVFYMGLMKNQSISNALIRHGVSSSMPVAIIENGTLSNQRVVTGNLEQMATLVELHQIKSPAIIVVGEVVSLASELAWFQGAAKTNLLKNESLKSDSSQRTGQSRLIAAS